MIDDQVEEDDSRRLPRQVRMTIESNAPPGLGEGKGGMTQANSIVWDSAWKGWDGFHVSLSKRSLLKDPLAEARARIQGTNAYRVFHLEELKMNAKIGLKYAVDGATFVADDELGHLDGGVELRRARLFAKGDCLLVVPVSFQLEIGYIPHEIYIEESYLAFRDVPWLGEFRAGQYQAPMGLDVVTSGRDISFMEPAAPLQALTPGVNAGIQAGRPVLDRRATWRVGLFTDGVGQDFGDAAEDYGRAIVRVTGLPLHSADPGEQDQGHLLHLGLSANILFSASGSVRYQSRPESHLAPYVVDTGEMTADGALVVGAEAAWVKGPLCLQGEYIHSWVDSQKGQVREFLGFYLSASWFLTGETRPYDPADGMFGRVIPGRSFGWGKGCWGAWELAARYSHVNLDHDDVHGGRLSMAMLGLNWHLHPNVKWRFDYGLGRVDGPGGKGGLNVFETRVEMDF